MGRRWDWFLGRTPKQLAKQEKYKAAYEAQKANRKAKRQRPTEFRRTCQRCGNIWYLPKELATEKAPSKRELFADKLDKHGSDMQDIARGSAGLRASDLESRIERRADRVLHNSMCPECGSTKYVQEPVFD